MPLLFASIGDELSITSISGTQASKQHLSDMGFSEGSKIIVIQKIPTGLIVKVKESYTGQYLKKKLEEYK